MVAFPAPSPPPPPAETRDGKWRQDVAYVAAELPRIHGNLFRNLREEDFGRAIADLDGEIPRLDDAEIAVSLARIAALADDAHTHLEFPPGRYPLGFHRFADGFFVVAATQAHRSALGARLVRVGETPVEETAERIAPLVPAEGNDSWRKLQVADLLSNAAVLRRLRLLPAGEEGRFGLERDGKAFEVVAPPLAAEDRPTWIAAPEGTLPDVRRRRSEKYWFEAWEGSGILYFQYNSCSETEGQPIGPFLESLLAAARSNPLRRLVIDLRVNGGGNSALLSPFITAIRKDRGLNRKGKILVLIGRRTFSSAVLNARELREGTKAIFVGEPTGGNPYSPFREVAGLRLPNAGLRLYYSQRCIRPGRAPAAAILPDVPVDVVSSDFFAGRDPVLEAALALPSPR
ncbi:MAG TPA: hypothetical protein VKF62_00315 [Planctomycetota bacterium]|nr:hypothetical protein [Planctomycetota bacterium]